MDEIVFLNIPVSKDIRDKAKIKAVECGQTLKEFVCDAIEEKIRKERP